MHFISPPATRILAAKKKKRTKNGNRHLTCKNELDDEYKCEYEMNVVLDECNTQIGTCSVSLIYVYIACGKSKMMSICNPFNMH